MPIRTMPRIAMVLAAVGGCVGTVVDEAEPPTEITEAPGGRIEGSVPTPAATACAAAGVHPGPSPLRRLTHAEYDATIRDLLGDTSAPGRGFPADERRDGFDNNAGALVVSDVLAERYEAAAERLSANAVRNLPALLQCDPVARGEDVCMGAFVRSFGLRAFRRPLDDGQAQRLLGLYAQARRDYDFASAVRMTLMAMLQWPGFLYRIDVAAPGGSGRGPSRLDDHSVAARLSYLLWGSMPDQELFRAAAAGELQQAARVAAQARRMLADPRAADTLDRFHGQWLGIDSLESQDKDRATYPRYSPQLAALLKQETRLFVDDVIRKGDGLLATLLRSSTSFLNRDLAAFYGTSGVTSDSFARTSLDPRQRAGLLTHASVLARYSAANRTSPVERGAFVRSAVLCSPLPPPPADVNAALPVPKAGATVRDLLAQHRSSPACASCHGLIDPVGLAFENYDGVGRWRDEEAGRPVDASGALPGTDVDGPVAGARELIDRLAGSRQASDCVVTTWFRFGQGRGPSADDACTLESLHTAFQASHGNLRDLIVALTQTDAFLYQAD
jgi:hypothetical protein